MSATILDHTVGATTERGANLSAAQILRPWKDDSWTTLRIGVRYCGINDTGANIPNPVWSIGVCSGSTQAVGDPLCAHGLYVGNNRSAVDNYLNMTRTAGADHVMFWDSGNTIYLGKYENSGTVTPFATGPGVCSLPPILVATSTTPKWRPFWFEITRDGGGAGIYTARSSYRSASTFETGGAISASTFLSQMELVTPSFTGMSYWTHTGLAIDEATYGVFDHINIFWDRLAPTVHISDVVVIKIA